MIYDLAKKQYFLVYERYYGLVVHPIVANNDKEAREIMMARDEKNCLGFVTSADISEIVRH